MLNSFDKLLKLSMQVFQTSQVSSFLLMNAYPCLDLVEGLLMLEEVKFSQTVAPVLETNTEFVILE